MTVDGKKKRNRKRIRAEVNRKREAPFLDSNVFLPYEDDPFAGSGLGKGTARVANEKPRLGRESYRRIIESRRASNNESDEFQDLSKDMTQKGSQVLFAVSRYESDLRSARKKNRKEFVRPRSINKSPSNDFQTVSSFHEQRKEQPISTKAFQKNKQKKMAAQQFRENKREENELQLESKLINPYLALESVVSKTEQLFMENRKTVLIIAAFSMLFMVIVGNLSGCVAIGNALTGSSGGAFFSKAIDIEKAELFMTKFEADLKAELNSVEDDYPDYDTYSYAIGNIGHNPNQLISYLSVRYPEFTFEDLEDILEELTGRMYEVLFDADTDTEEKVTTKSEVVKKVRPVIRTKTVTKYKTVRDPKTGRYRQVSYEVEVEYEDEEEYEEIEEHEETEIIDIDVLLVTVLSTSLDKILEEDIENEVLTEGDRELYETYLQTGGGLQFISSPIDGEWMDKVSSYYGYRVHPIDGEVKLHKGMDLALSEGTNVYAGISGTVVKCGFDSEYGNYVEIKADNGIHLRYAHLKTITVSKKAEVLRGDLIGLSGNTGKSTGPHLHMEIFDDETSYNPIFYVMNGNGGET